MNRNLLILGVVVIVLIAGAYYLGTRSGGVGDSSLSTTTAQTSAQGSNIDTNTDTSVGFEATTPLTEMLVNLEGVWQSDSDARFTREFKLDKTTTDYYVAGADSSEVSGDYTVFTGTDAPADAYFPLDKNARYLNITPKGSATFHYRISKLTSIKLELIYLDRGGALSFTKKK